VPSGVTETKEGPGATAGRPVPPPAGRRPDRRFRVDIEGLRAVAVVAVVAFHAGIGFLSGGFVGVDVFYVISGFLITDHLWRELGRSGRLSLAGFYARRARRLLPAAMVVLVATMAASAALLPPLLVRQVWKDGVFCALYAGNFRFAATQTNYLADAAPSPFQHFWSLGVEEQFYLVWPVLLVVASLALWRRRPSRPAALVALATVTAASLVLSVTLTRSDQPVAFFLLPTRAWELAIGGLIALGSPWLERMPVGLSAILGWSGLSAIAASCVAYGAHTSYPGDAALLPVVGAAAVIVSGLAAPENGPVLLLGRAPMRVMGRISYSWYLWHYPVLILAPYALGHPLGLPAGIGLAVGSGMLAVITFRFVEEPARQARWLSGPPSRSLLSGLALSSAGVLACLGAAITIPSLHGHGVAPTATIHQTQIPGRSSSSPGTPTTSVDPALTAFQSAEAQVVAAVTASAAVKEVPANLTPPLSSASASEAAPMVDGCLLSYTESVVASCLFGDTTASRSVVLFGDSHAAMWFPAVDEWANANGYRLYTWTKAACPPVDITLFSPVLGRTWTECQQWYSNVMARIAATGPALVVLGIAPNYDSAYDVVQNGPAWQAGLSATIAGLRRTGSRVMVIGSIPGPVSTVPDCLSANLDDIPACEFSPVGRRVGGGGLVGIDQPGDAAEASTVRAGGAFYADVDKWFCTPTTCDVIVDNLLVYRDNSHVTVPYALYLGPLVGDAMTLTLSGATSPDT
jgi:peptidoglycan/LPS O-acetylase OafA/YrhL